MALRVALCHICGSSESDVPKMFYFPKNLEKSKLWQENMGVKYVGESLHNYRICSRHFTPESYRNPLTYTLNRNAVPTLFPMTSHPESGPDVRMEVTLCDEMVAGSSTGMVEGMVMTGSAAKKVVAGTSVGAVVADSSVVADVAMLPAKPAPSKSCFRASFRGIANMSKAEATPRKQQLVKMVLSKEDHIRKLKKICKSRAYDIKALSDLSDSNVVRNIFEGMPSNTADFLIAQLRCAKRQPKGRRWTDDEKIVALALYKRSPRCYNLLRRLVAMPSKRTLMTLLQRVPFATGINRHIFQQVSQSLVFEEDRICVLLFDEIDIKENLQYDVANDVILGFEDAGDGTVSTKLANRALVFMLQGLGKKKWKQPVAYYFSNNGCKSDKLRSCLHAVLSAAKEAKLEILATICDMGSSNVKMMKDMGVSIDRPFFEYEGDTIFAMYDPPHLLKRTAALFRQHVVLLPVTIGDHEAEMEAKFQDVVTAHEIDSATPFVFRALYKLKSVHLQPKLQFAMKVKLAAQLMSRTVSMCIYSLMSRGDMEQRALATATFIQQVDELFDSFNGSQLKPAEGKEVKCCVTKDSIHMDYWKSAVQKVSSWKFRRITKTGALLKGMPPSQTGWLTTLNAIQGVWEALEKKDFKQLRPRSLNQDPLENLFGQIRGGCGCSDNPTTFQFVGSLKTQILNGLTNQSPVGTNCLEDDGVLLNNLRCFLTVTTEPQHLDAATLGVATLPPDVEEPQSKIDFAEALAQCASNTLSVAYVSGYIAKKLLVTVNNCDTCKELLCSSSLDAHNLFISLKEWSDSTSKMTYPSETLVVAVGTAITMLENALPSIGGTSGSSKVAAVTIMEQLKTMNLSCDIHSDRLREALIRGITRIGIPWWCRRKNEEFNTQQKEKRALKKTKKTAKQRKVAKFAH